MNNYMYNNKDPPTKLDSHPTHTHLPSKQIIRIVLTIPWLVGWLVGWLVPLSHCYMWLSYD